MAAKTPAAFIGHGSPMNALEVNRYTGVWRGLGAAAGKPRAVLVISAHWYIPHTAVTAMSRPRTIHDFFGFPQALYDVKYPAPGDAHLASEIAEIAKPAHVGLDADSWGLDHGTWSVLMHVFPDADVPVLQLSINTTHAPDWHMEFAARLAPLREQGVMILGSGNVVHNLRAMDRRQPDLGFDWAWRFGDAATELLTTQPENLPSLVSHPDFARAVPTPDHFVPALYLAGLASAAKQPLTMLAEGYAFGSISMACYALDAKVGTSRRTNPSAPLNASVPPENTNT